MENTKQHFYNPTLTVENGGQFYCVTYNIWNNGYEGEQTESFRSYNEAKKLYNKIPLK